MRPGTSEYVARRIYDDQGEQLFPEYLEKVIRCRDCKYYQGGCCVRFGKMEHPRREPEDFCSRGERRK